MTATAEEKRAKRKAAKIRRKNRAERKRLESIAYWESVLAITCPVPECTARPGVYCYSRGGIPGVHERRDKAARAWQD